MSKPLSAIGIGSQHFFMDNQHLPVWETTCWKFFFTSLFLYLMFLMEREHDLSLLPGQCIDLDLRSGRRRENLETYTHDRPTQLTLCVILSTKHFSHPVFCLHASLLLYLFFFLSIGKQTASSATCSMWRRYTHSFLRLTMYNYGKLHAIVVAVAMACDQALGLGKGGVLLLLQVKSGGAERLCVANSPQLQIRLQSTNVINLCFGVRNTAPPRFIVDLKE